MRSIDELGTRPTFATTCWTQNELGGRHAWVSSRTGLICTPTSRLDGQSDLRTRRYRPSDYGMGLDDLASSRARALVGRHPQRRRLLGVEPRAGRRLRFRHRYSADRPRRARFARTSATLLDAAADLPNRPQSSPLIGHRLALGPRTRISIFCFAVLPELLARSRPCAYVALGSRRAPLRGVLRATGSAVTFPTVKRLLPPRHTTIELAHMIEAGERSSC